MMDLDSFIDGKRRWLRFTPADVDMAANGIILALDGNIARADAVRCARAALTAAYPLLMAENERLREAASDALAGWRYIRANHGDLYGVGWDRVETALSPEQRD